MEQPGTTPVIPADELTPPRVSRWRWWVHLSVLAAYPIVLGVAGAMLLKPGSGPLLPSDPLRLAGGVVQEIFLFGVIFFLAWSASRASIQELRLEWTSALAPVARGLLYGIGLQLAVMLIGIIIRAVVAMSGGHVEALENLQPDYERLVDPKELAKPIYLWLNVSLVSFVLGGLREELWRSGMLAGLAQIAPKVFGSTTGQVWAVCIAAISFGLGHLAQGWGGVLVTSMLGVALGLIMIWHRTIWTAVFAHGFFDAVSFFLLYVAARYFPEQLHKLG